MLISAAFYTLALILITRRASQRAKKEYREEYGPETVPPIQPKWRLKARYAVMLMAGIALTVVGAELLVRSASDIARSLGVSDTIIGLTIVAIGTSAPELVTTIISTIKDDRDVAVGNLLGSSIYNILIILSVPCIVSPGGLPVERQLLWFDIPLMAGVAIGAIPIFVTGKCINRVEGGLGVAIYLTYLSWLILFRPF
jgi:cation:H+ antiporter